MKLYAIGDIHGCYTEFVELFDLIMEDAGNDPCKIVFLGDYVDRGPDSCLVVSTLINLKKINPEGVEFVFLKGNHEDMLVKAVLDAPTRNDEDMFFYNGGAATQASYERHKVSFSSHEEFYRSLERYHRHGDFLFVHAGIAPTDTIQQAVREIDYYDDQLLWDRQWNNYDGAFPENVFVVHGHTPTPEIKYLPNQINIDTGCVFGKEYSEQYGQLTAVRLDGRTKEEIKVFQVRKKF